MRTIFKKYSHLIKPFDIIIVLVLLALSFLPNAIFAYQQATRKEEAKIYAILTIDGEEIERFELSENAPHEEFIYFPHDDQYNIMKSMERVFVTRKIIVQTKSQYKRDGFPSRDRPVSACHMGWWLRLSQPSPRLVIMTPLSRYKTMWSSLQSWRTFFVPATVPVPRRRAFCPLPSDAPNGLKSHSAFFIHQAFSEFFI